MTFESLRHPNIVTYIGACTKEESKLCVLQELCSQGSLSLYLFSKSLGESLSKRLEIAIGIALGMEYLHSFVPPLLHRDLCPEHILIDEFGTPKIANFSLSRLKADKMTIRVGSARYMAPEVILSETYTEKADVYSFGVILWEVITKQKPFEYLADNQIILEVGAKKRTLKIPEDCHRAIGRLIQRCTDHEPTLRPIFKEIIFELRDFLKKIHP